MAYVCYGIERQTDVRNIVEQVHEIGCEMKTRYEKLDFCVLMEHYFGHRHAEQHHLVHFLHELMTQNVNDTWSWNMCQTFVEVIIRESSDIQINYRIIDDYLRVCV